MTTEPVPNHPSLPTARALEILSQGVLEREHGMMRWSSNYTFLLTAKHEGQEAMAVYKPRSGERPLWDFPDGTLCQREVAAFTVSEALGWGLVPPTVLREGPRGIGSFQLYIEHDPELNYFSFDPSVKPQLEWLVLFDALINNADRKGGHCLLDLKQRLWAIDHGITFHVQHKLRTVIWDFSGQAIPSALIDDLTALNTTLGIADSPLRCALAPLLSEGEIEACMTRLRRLLRTAKYPSPGPGPNYPWPPV
jgi:hypothetical protein